MAHGPAGHLLLPLHQPAAVSAGWTLVASTTGGGGGEGPSTSGTIDTTGANLLVLFIGDLSDSTPSDSKGNTWVSVDARPASTSGKMYYVENPIVGTGHVFTVAPRFASCCVAAYSGAASSSVFDVTHVADAAQPGSITPTEDGCLVLTGVLHGDGSNAPLIDSGFTVINQRVLVGGQNFGGGLASIVQSTAAAVNPTWSVVTPLYKSIISSFKPGGGALPVTDLYTELEWSLAMQAPAADADVYQFRVYAGSTPLTTYAVTPQLTAIVPTVPTAPVLNTATAGNTAVALAWSAPSSNGGSAITDYVIEKSPNGTSSWTTVTESVSTATTYSVTGLTNDVIQYFRVSAVNAVGTGTASNVLSATPAGGGGGVEFSDTFDGTGALSANWAVQGGGTMTRVSGVVQSPDFFGVAAVYQTQLSSAACYAQVDFLVGGGQAELAVCGDGTSFAGGHPWGYAVSFFPNGSVYAIMKNGTAMPDSGTSTTVSAGWHTWRLEHNGAGGLTLYRDDVVHLSYTDPGTPLTTKYAAFGWNYPASSTPSADNFETGTLGSGWTPDALDLIGWWDASDTASITASGGTVSQWADKSGNGLHFAQATSGSQPTTGSVTLNGLNALGFDGSADYLTVDAGSDSMDFNPVSVYAVMRLEDYFSAYIGIMSIRIATSSLDEQSPNAILLQGWDNHAYNTWCNGQVTSTVGGGTVDIWRLVHMSFNGTTASISVDGGTPATVAWTSPPNLVRYLRIGGRLQSGVPPSVAANSNIDVAEIIIAHDADNTAAYTYLADKWDLTVTIP